MKEFDNFQSWLEEENKSIKKYKETPNYTKFIEDFNNESKNKKWVLKLIMGFYLKYYYLGYEYLVKHINQLTHCDRREILIELVDFCKSFNESLKNIFKERYFHLTQTKQTNEIISKYMPVTEESIHLYIKGKHDDPSVFIDSVSAMMMIAFNESNKYPYRQVHDFGLILGVSFEHLFHQIVSHNNPLIRKSLPKINIRLRYYYEAINEADIDEDNHLFQMIEQSLDNCQKLYTISWENVLFQNGYFLVFHPKHPDGQGKYKPFRVECPNSVKAFNHVKEYILKKLPPIEVIYEDGIIVGIETSYMSSMEDAIITLSKHTSAPIIKIEGQKESKFEHFRGNNFTNQEAKEALRLLKSQYLDYLSSVHNDADKLYYCIEKRINSNAIVVEEDTFFFSIKSNHLFTLLAFENTSPSRATILFTCKNDEIHKSIYFIHDYFSSPEINKREKFLVKKLNLLDYGIIRYERVLHENYSSWLTHIDSARERLND